MLEFCVIKSIAMLTSDLPILENGPTDFDVIYCVFEYNEGVISQLAG